VLPPPPPGHPPCCDNHQKVDRKIKPKEGVKGVLPLDCLPLWGREGVTFIAFLKKRAATGFHQRKKHISFFSILTGDKP